MQLRNRWPTLVVCLSASLAVLASLAPMHLSAQDDDNPKPERHGRKYKAPPDTSRIEVTVIKGFNKKPIVNAAVVFHPVKDGEDEGRLEMKTDPDGKAVIDVIPTGSSVRIQVIADGFATFAEDYVVSEASRKILITMVRPRAQVSAYVDNNGKELQAEPGAQVPVRPKLDSSGRPVVTPAPSDGAGSGSGSGSGSAGTSGSTTSGSKPQ